MSDVLGRPSILFRGLHLRCHLLLKYRWPRRGATVLAIRTNKHLTPRGQSRRTQRLNPRRGFTSSVCSCFTCQVSGTELLDCVSILSCFVEQHPRDAQDQLPEIASCSVITAGGLRFDDTVLYTNIFFCLSFILFFFCWGTKGNQDV